MPSDREPKSSLASVPITSAVPNNAATPRTVSMPSSMTASPSSSSSKAAIVAAAVAAVTSLPSSAAAAASQSLPADAKDTKAVVTTKKMPKYTPSGGTGSDNGRDRTDTAIPTEAFQTWIKKEKRKYDDDGDAYASLRERLTKQMNRASHRAHKEWVVFRARNNGYYLEPSIMRGCLTSALHALTLNEMAKEKQKRTVTFDDDDTSLFTANVESGLLERIAKKQFIADALQASHGAVFRKCDMSGEAYDSDQDDDATPNLQFSLEHCSLVQFKDERKMLVLDGVFIGN
jgi:hypothetical protein